MLACVIATGCASQARLPASYFAEGGHVLSAGEIGVTAAGGAGTSADGSGTGIGGRARVGVGGGNEVGVEAAQLTLDSPSYHCTFDCGPGDNSRYTTRARSVALSWKHSILDNAAIVATVGGAHHDRIAGDPMPAGDYVGTSVNGSLGLIGSHPIGHDVDAYGGLRASAGVPVGATNASNAMILGASTAIGLDVAVTRNLHLYGEASAFATGSEDDDFFPTFGVTAIGGIGVRL